MAAHRHPFAANDGGSTATCAATFTPDDEAATTLQRNVDIEAGLRDGTLTAEQAVVLQERQLRAEMVARERQLRAEMQEQMAQLEARLGTGDSGSPLTAAVRGVVARLTETPTNFHQATEGQKATYPTWDSGAAARGKKQKGKK